MPHSGHVPRTNKVLSVQTRHIGTTVWILLFISFTLHELRRVASWNTNANSSILSAEHVDDSLGQLSAISAIRRPPPLPADCVVSLPSEYEQAPSQLSYCAERFGRAYLQNLAHSSVQYCDSGSDSSLTCFRSQTAADGRVDSFCIGGPATLDEETKIFNLDCHPKLWTMRDIANGIPSLKQFPRYWYRTGPRIIFNKYVELEATDVNWTSTAGAATGYSILVKRETSHHLWHALMEIFSLFMTLDVLHMTRNPVTNEPFLNRNDIENTRIVILDNHPEGPYFDLWTLFGKQPVMKMNNISTHTPIISENIIIPLPGGSNPFWQGDWEDLPCEHSEMLQVFSKRVLDFYQINDEPKAVHRWQLKLTFIDRKGQRRLIDQDRYIARLRSRFPTVDIELVDFAIYPFAEQLRIVRNTDILVGVHGAGLTHGIFLPPGSTMVEILPHDFQHKGFRNLAKLRGHQYFRSEAAKQAAVAKTEIWQLDDVFLEEDRFMYLIETAIKSAWEENLGCEGIA